MRRKTKPKAAPVEMAVCDDCGHRCPTDDLDEYKDYWSRVTVGRIVPAGDCPKCGAFSYIENGANAALVEAMNKYGVTRESDGWHRVTRNGRIIRAYLPFLARRSDLSTRPDGYNLFMFRKDAASAARKMNALAARGLDKMAGFNPHR